ncbi:MAG: FemAB family PEP-CTERM system-associated protein [Phycisphaerae bacterium]|nr:FemAB family PEP-CTERM system-associated protein [Phycisphaerae bacterium]
MSQQPQQSPLDIRPCNIADCAEWDSYVRSKPEATVFHTAAWNESVRKAYGHEPRNLGAWANGKLVGVLPLFEVKSVFVGKVLVSIPYATYGGVVADTSEIAQAILTEAQNIARQHDIEYLELRNREPSGFDLPVNDRYDTFRQQLPENPQDILPSLPKKARAAARHGLEEFTVDIDSKWLDTIYDLYSITLRRLGSPNYSRKFFRQLQTQFGDDCVCLVVLKDGKPVAGVVSYVFRDELVAYFSGSIPGASRTNASNVMYLKLMEHTVERGLRWFDFNRTRRDNNGPHAFKRHLGFTPTPLCYQTWLNKTQELPNLSPSNRKFAAAGKVWRKMPLWFTKAAGGKITKWIP